MNSDQSDLALFDNADYFLVAGEDPDELQFREPSEALTHFLDRLVSIDGDAVAVIRKNSPITVVAYDPDTASEEWKRHAAERLFDSVCEDFHDAYGSPEDGLDAAEVASVEHAAKTHLRAAIDVVVAGLTMYNCKEAARREYSAEAVEEMMREWNPEWFEVEK